MQVMVLTGRWKMLTATSGSGSLAKQSSEEGAARGVFGWKDKGGGQTAVDVIGALRWHRMPRGVPATVAGGGDRRLGNEENREKADRQRRSNRAATRVGGDLRRYYVTVAYRRLLADGQ